MQTRKRTINLGTCRAFICCFCLVGKCNKLNTDDCTSPYVGHAVRVPGSRFWTRVRPNPSSCAILHFFSSLKERSLLSGNACRTSRPAARVRRAFADHLDAGQSKRRPQLHRRQAVGSGWMRLERDPFPRANAVSTSSAPPSRLNATAPEGHARVGQHSRAGKLARDQIKRAKKGSP